MMDEQLWSFSHPSMHRRYTWDISTAPDANRKLQYITDPHSRRIAGWFLLQFDTMVQPVLSTLRHAYAHNDANDHNLLVRDGKIAGLIDFGDMVYTALINNLAVACTYAMFDAADPLQAAACVVSGYHHCVSAHRAGNGSAVLAHCGQALYQCYAICLEQRQWQHQ